MSNLFWLTDAQMDQYYQMSFRNLAGARLQRVPNARHFIMYDQPDIFVGEVRTFLAAPARSGDGCCGDVRPVHRSRVVGGARRLAPVLALGTRHAGLHQPRPRRLLSRRLGRAAAGWVQGHPPGRGGVPGVGLHRPGGSPLRLERVALAFQIGHFFLQRGKTLAKAGSR